MGFFPQGNEERGLGAPVFVTRVRKLACVIEGPSPAESLLSQSGTSCDIWSSALQWHAMCLFLRMDNSEVVHPKRAAGVRKASVEGMVRQGSVGNPARLSVLTGVSQPAVLGHTQALTL